MTIKSGLTALIAVFSAVLIFAPSANAQEKTDTKKDDRAPVVVKVQEGDTLSSIADANHTTYVRIFNANDFIANPDIINVGDEIRIPAESEELTDRYGAQYTVPAYTAHAQPTAYTTPRSGAAKTYYAPSSSSGNTYARGYCTWYAKERRPDLPNMLGNGGQWVSSAAARGLATGTTPRAGAILEMPGHVAYVESVNSDGSIVISDMNGPAGFGVVGTRTISGQYRYIY